jgi:hypothetical protein
MRQHDRSTAGANRKRTRGSLSPGGHVETKSQFISRIPFNNDWGSRDENFVCKRSGGIRANAGCGSSESPTKTCETIAKNSRKLVKARRRLFSEKRHVAILLLDCVNRGT